jgi:WD40-like Beta Propeller Repeat
VLVLLVGVAAGVLGACDWSHASAKRHTRARKPVVHRVVVDPGVSSPDGRQVAFVKHVFVTQTGSNGYLMVGPTAGAKRPVYSSNDSCCTNLIWRSPRLLFFDDDYNVKTVDPRTRRVRRIAGFSDFATSPDGQLVAGWKYSGGHSPETIGVVSVARSGCRFVTRPKNADDSEPSFSPDGTRLSFLRRSYSTVGEGSGRVVTIPLTALRRAGPRFEPC